MKYFLIPPSRAKTSAGGVALVRGVRRAWCEPVVVYRKKEEESGAKTFHKNGAILTASTGVDRCSEEVAYRAVMQPGRVIKAVSVHRGGTDW